MKQGHIFGLLATVFSACTSAVGTARASSTITPVSIKGNAFYQGTERFYIRGVDYAPGGGIGTPTDPIADAAGCARDIPYFTRLGINTIRVYTIDNAADHDTCMNALADAGIYLVLDASNTRYSLNRDNPVPSYNSVYLQSVFATIDAFAAYPNTLAFLSGNEVINNAANTNVAPYVKATTRDMKQYISSRGHRQIPVGYSAADVNANQQLMAEYLNCGTDDQRTDFYSINDYSWCDPSTFQVSGWDTLVANYTSYGIPLFMSEYGCITNTRTFHEVAALYSPEMTSVFSGGLVYEYSQEGNGYGLVTISNDTTTINDQFTYLETAFKDTPNPTGDGGATTSSPASDCPPESAEWEVANNDLPPLPAAAKQFMKDGAGTGPGLKGPGSQFAGSSGSKGTGTSTAGPATVTEIASPSQPTATGSSEGAATPLSLHLSVVGVALAAITMGMMLL